MQVIDVAFVIAVVAFFRERVQISGYRALIAAFAVAVLFNIAPIVAQSFPVISPWLDALLNSIVLFIAAAGSVDFGVWLIRKR
ncbi:MAG: hypothetical protein DCC56_02875 [Anaerolineae bacterium]|nr:MAG: hypothetical protein DCC56_02875 [Anaerolineae bacterium]WKZ44219.1 MAG: hypothetical protein QY302_00340 [Anaerolineales bacterium]